MELKGSKTDQNLKDALVGESPANIYFLYFAANADVKVCNDVAIVFRFTAEGEIGHAHEHLEYPEAVGNLVSDYRANKVKHFSPKRDNSYA